MTSPPTDNESNEKEQARSKFDFSIEHILKRAGNPIGERKTAESSHDSFVPFPWLHCTRYCPPKIPRHQKREAPQKRQLGRHPRIPFTSHQLSVLEEKFRETPYLSSTEVTKLSKNLHLADIRVKIWFQNRRARERRERIQSETEQRPKTQETFPTKHPQVPESYTGNDLIIPSIFPIFQRATTSQECLSTKHLINVTETLNNL